MLGDGSKRMSNNVWTYSTSSMKLRDNIQEICLKIGYAGDYVLCKSHDQFSKISNKIIHINDYWNVTIKRKQVEPRNRQSWGHLSRDFEEEWVDYQGTIWCVTVPNHTVYVRRNGKVAWSSQSDKEDRKAHGRMMKAMRYFLDSNPDVKEKDITWIYHSNPVDPRGMPLSSICHKFKLDNVIRFMDPKIADVMITEEQLCALYNAMDVHVLCSKREGFGMPIIESQACGIPNICHDFSSMTELVKGHGWLCKSLGQDLNLETTPINAETAFPDVYSIADCIKDAYFDDKKREGFGLKSREFALRYNWDDLVHNSWVPLLEDIQEDLKNLPGRNIFGISNRKDEIFKSKFKEACK
jgi:glycosyltransferase involved in cell wall biosynthesis